MTARKLRLAWAGLRPTTKETAVAKTVDDFKLDAMQLYDRTRDEGRMMAILEITQALVAAHYAGVEEGVRRMHARVIVAGTPEVLDLTGDPPLAADDPRRGGGL